MSRFSELLPAVNDDIESVRTRVQQLELLCADVYDAVVELGLPQPLLDRLHTVAARRSRPHSLSTEMPSRPPAAAAPDAPKPELATVPKRRRVMVVDDDPMMMEVLIRILQRENYDLMVASSGTEALEKATTLAEPLELLITDYAMPGMKGHELAQRMRERYPNVRVLYQTGFSDVLFENKVQLDQSAAFLEKPFTARGLRDAARAILSGAINPTDA